MATTEAFVEARRNWEAEGGGTAACDSPQRERWYFHHGAPWEGDWGCLRCGHAIEEHEDSDDGVAEVEVPSPDAQDEVE